LSRSDHPSTEEIDARLRECSRASEGYYGVPAISMSREAITERLIELAELSALCFELGTLREAALSIDRARGTPRS
jgi:hypothetical protein